MAINFIRDEKIIEYIQKAKNQRASVEELAKFFDISESTIRRDLNRLNKEHKLVKIHGGATSIGGYLGEITFDRVDKEYFEREETDIDIKNAIARYASKLVKSNMCVYLDASTTVASMIPYLPLLSNTYFVTNSPNLAIKLSELGHRVYVTGGELKLTTNAYIGGYALDFLDKFNFSLGFFGTNGIHPTSGFTTPDPSEASIKMKAISKCYSVYILASHNKFDNISSATFSSFNKICLITDEIPAKYVNLIKHISLKQESKE